MASTKSLAIRATFLLLVATSFVGILGNTLPNKETKDWDSECDKYDRWDDLPKYCKDSVCDKGANEKWEDECKLAVGIIIAIVVGSLVLIIGAIILCCCCCGLLCFAGRKSAQTV